MSNVALIDADIVCYQAAIVACPEIDWDGAGEKVPAPSPAAARKVAGDIIDRWTEAAKCKRAVLVFSDRTAPRTSFRYHIHPHYKANRIDDKPVLHDLVKESLEEKYRNIYFPGLEGDDAIGLMLTGEDAGKYVGVTLDKDFLTIPGRVCLIPHSGEPTPRKISMREANYNWMYQTLVGDPADNYKGAPGIGPVAARKILGTKRNLTTMWDAVVATFEKQAKHKRWGAEFVHSDHREEAVMNAQCARILRHGDYDDSVSPPMVRLWEPDEDAVTWICPF